MGSLTPLEPDGLPSSQHCGIWSSKAKLGPVAVSIASAYPTAQWSANCLKGPSTTIPFLGTF